MDRGTENSYEPNHIKGSFSIQAAVSFKTDLCLLRVYCMLLHKAYNAAPGILSMSYVNRV